jgi:uncharacterized protein YlxW (UPF0749 family)
MRPAATRGQLLAALLCAVLGFSLVAQVRQTLTGTMTTLRQADLIGLLQRVSEVQDRYDQEAADLQRQLADLQSGSDRAAVAEQAARRQLEIYQVLAGTRPVSGPGVRLDIEDPNRSVTAAMVLDTVQELRGAGAEAIQVGGVRVVAQTAFVDAPTGITVDGVPVTAPYRILAIGRSTSLARALAIPGGVLESLSARGASGQVQELAQVGIDALARPRITQYAQPASPAATP